MTEQGPEATAVRAEVEQFRQRIQALRDEIGKAIVGNQDVVDGVLTCMLAGGHALLEAMAEHRVSVGNRTHILDEPFVVLATQNPLEMEGTYPLPEAQLDRFFFKLNVPFPNRDELHSILDLTTGVEQVRPRAVVDKATILEMQKLVRRVPVARHVQDYAIRVIQATHPDYPEAPELTKRFGRVGGSPRGAQSILLAAKIRALFEGRFAASVDDVRAAALPALRHRILLNFEGEAEGMKTDQLIEAVLKSVPEAKVGIKEKAQGAPVGSA